MKFYSVRGLLRQLYPIDPQSSDSRCLSELATPQARLVALAALELVLGLFKVRDKDRRSGSLFNLVVLLLYLASKRLKCLKGKGKFLAYLLMGLTAVAGLKGTPYLMVFSRERKAEYSILIISQMEAINFVKQNKFPLLAGIGIVSVGLFLEHCLAEDDPFAPTGLVNQGNTCFANSLFQCLSACPSLVSYLQNLALATTKLSTKEKDLPIIRELAQLLSRIAEDEQSVISPVQFFDRFNQKYQNIFNFEQQDAHQLFVLIVQTIENVHAATLKPTLALHKQIGEIVFRGRTILSFECRGCGQVLFNRVQPFSVLTLEIVSPNLKECIEQLQMSQLVEDYNCVNCSLRSMLLQKQSLAKQLHLKGQCQDLLPCISEQVIAIKNQMLLKFKDIEAVRSNVQKLIKSQDAVQKLQQSEQKRFLSGLPVVRKNILLNRSISETPRLLILHLKRTVYEHGRMKVNLAQVAFDQCLLLSEARFVLRGVLVHVGTANYGHYYAFRKSGCLWFELSDQHSREVGWQRVQKQKAYMLFYQQY